MIGSVKQFRWGKLFMAPRRTHQRRPAVLESLETRALLASLSTITDQVVGTGIGLPVVLTNSGTNNQSYTATSSNPDISLTVPQAHFLTIGVSHASSGASDPAFSGNITFQMFGDLTPVTVARIEQLVQSGFYTSPTQPTTGTALPSKNFHRIVPGFVVQGGSQSGDGSGAFSGPGFPYINEPVQQLVFNGNYQVAMANAGQGTNDTQFFITTGQQRSLDYGYTIFGQVVAGTNIVDQMFKVAQGTNNVPTSPILITSSTISAGNPSGVLLVNTTKATPGESSTVTVTAKDPANNTTTTQTFQVLVGANVNATGQAVQEPPFLVAVPDQVVATTQTDVFQLQAVNPTGNPLTYKVAGGVTGSGSSATFSPVQNATATVDANGVVKVVPNTGFTGVINLLIGVEDNQVRLGGNAVGNPSNYFQQKLTLTVRNGQVVTLPPIASPGSTTVSANAPSTVQLTGTSANPSTSQGLTYQILSGPSHGSVSNFDTSKGTFTYTPSPNFQGNDTLQFGVSEAGVSPTLTSQPATFTITVGGVNTGYVRVLDGVLLVSAPPKGHGTNVIQVTQVNGNVQVSINGLIDKTQPAMSSLDSMSIYGSKVNDQILIDPSVTTPATLNGGRGGRNTLSGGGGSTREHGWFGANTLLAGAQPSQLIGRSGNVKFKPKSGEDLMYAGQGSISRYKNWAAYPSANGNIQPPSPPTGTFYKLVKGHIVQVTPAPAKYFRKDVARIGSRFDQHFG